ncbi:tetratricopeptide repeat protein [Xanthomarina sp. F2636L]|uniref:tetratricopeptide repeat protein n=1 Tax=Xanthomarina sp. F2636L TaxID=2996018 RepID=UPI00225E2742|nr:tetratricopeptide repeat protein [Xanthomarina sp. F2636L]MCX7550732.1 tetratricopeptide repeat protein [Xanthomarina sp. F2636L]
MKKLVLFFLCPLWCFSQTSYQDLQLLLEQKNYTKAEALVTPIVTSNPTDVKAIELLGDTYAYQEKWDEAMEQYKKLTSLKPKVANYHYKYGGALGMKALSVNKLSALVYLSDLKEAFLTAAKLDKNHIETRWALVELYMQLPAIVGGSKDTSLKYAEELEQLSKVDGYLAKGYIYEYDDEAILAERYYKKAIEIGGSITCYNKLSEFYENQKQPEKAISNIEEAQEKLQRNGLHYQLGKVSAEYNMQLEKGEACLKNYIKNYSPEDGVPIAWANYRLAQIYRQKNNKTEALKYINLAVKELPEIKVFQEERSAILKL